MHQPSRLVSALRKHLNNIFIKIQFDHKSKYIIQVIFNKSFPLLKQKVIINDEPQQ
jgi:hypothetical protein